MLQNLVNLDVNANKRRVSLNQKSKSNHKSISTSTWKLGCYFLLDTAYREHRKSCVFRVFSSLVSLFIPCSSHLSRVYLPSHREYIQRPPPFVLPRFEKGQFFLYANFCSGRSGNTDWIVNKGTKHAGRRRLYFSSISGRGICGYAGTIVVLLTSAKRISHKKIA